MMDLVARRRRQVRIVDPDTARARRYDETGRAYESPWHRNNGGMPGGGSY